MSLTFEAFRDLLARVFQQIPDQRDPSRITWEMPAVLMSAFAMFFFQHPNLLEYQREQTPQPDSVGTARDQCCRRPVPEPR